LQPGEGLFVGGDVEGLTDPVEVAPPLLPEQRTYPATWPRGVWLGVVAALCLAAAWQWSQRRGRNEVSGATPADAAYATGEGTRLLTDAELQRLATLEVSPPEGLTPWEGAVLMREAVDDTTIEAWFGHAAAVGRIALHEEDGRLVIIDRPESPRLSSVEETALDCLFGDGAARYEVKGYDPRFARAWENLRTHQQLAVKEARWWRGQVRQLSGRRASAAAAAMTVAALAVMALTGSYASDHPSDGVTALGSLVVATMVVMVLSLVIGWVLWWPLRAARTAAGSALALRTMSFHRFLAHSEGRHVEEAWKRGVLREYTAWAVALGEADTWRRAADAAAVPAEAATAVAASSLLWHRRGDLASAHTKPSTTGGSAGGSGSVGSGGGGGRSGSW
jgi:uncharacterized membrane protein YgcG